MDSDIDIIIVSQAFEGKEVGERFMMVKGAVEVDTSLEVLAYTPAEFQKAKARSSILRDMLQYAIRLL